MSIVLDRQSGQFGVFRVVQVRPDAQLFDYGFKYNADRTVQSGIFSKNELLVEMNIVVHVCPIEEDDFMVIGSDLLNPKFGPRYMKYSGNQQEHGWTDDDRYFGEWSLATQKPHGRGIRIYKDGAIRIGHWDNGVYADGRYIQIYSNGRFDVGERTKNAEGKKHFKYTSYNKDGTNKQFDY